VAVFSGAVDPTIKRLWNRINLALIFNCLPSMVGDELNLDIQATKIVFSARDEMKNKPTEGDDR
jgi:hypothetical protein